MDINDSNFWNNKYFKNENAWDISKPTPIFVDWEKTLKNSKSIIIPGSGKGYDAIYLASKGHHVCAVDFSTIAINHINRISNYNHLKAIHKDVFKLPKQYFSKFDICLEYTFFCAIHPNRRKDYIKLSYNLLKPGGYFIGILIPINKKINEGGPPFGVDLDETIKLFSQYYHIINIEKSPLSIESRKNNEVFIKMQKNA